MDNTNREEKMNSSANLKELATALANAQATLQIAKKGSENPFFHSKYADLLSVWTACREALTTNGLSVVQVIDVANDGKTFLETILLHASGEWIAGRLPLLAIKQDPQAQGSAISYARRYSLSAIIGLCTEEEDDDAEGAMDRGKSEPEEDICPIHGVPFRKFTKDNQKWWSHKTEDGWCNKDKLESPLEEMDAVPEFKNLGDFFMKAYKKWKLPKSKVMKLLELTSIEELKDPTGAWVALTELIKEA